MTEFYDAHATAKEGEPTFTLQGGDPDAPEAICHYADKVRTRARATSSKKQATALLHRAAACEEVAWAFDSYRRDEKTPVAKRAQYNIDATDLAAGAVAAVDKRGKMISAAQRLRNAVGLAKEVEEDLAKLGINEGEQAAILQSIAVLNSAADALDPRAPHERT